jgi:large subunit ribosomal protein L23
MALFGIGKKDKAEEKVAPVKKEGAVKAAPAATSATSHASHLAHILKTPRITEKATMHAGAGVYVFDVADRATKRSIAEAVSSVYNVRPRMVRIVTIPTKMRRNMRTGKSGTSRGGKKAYVYLKKGDIITVS